LYIRDDLVERTNALALAAASILIGFLAGIVVCLGVLINERVLKDDDPTACAWTSGSK